METITIGDKKIGIRTSVLEEKATACNMLCCYADELKEGFYPWIDQVTYFLVPLFVFFSRLYISHTWEFCQVKKITGCLMKRYLTLWLTFGATQGKDLL